MFRFIYGAVIVLIFGISAVFGEGSKLPVLYDAPKFEFTDQNNALFKTDSLNGKVWVVDFKFTSCPAECPPMMTAMKNVQGKLKGVKDVEFVSITTDPVRDTPKVLKDFMAKHKADESNWHFLTGNKQTIVKVSQDGFKFAADEKKPTHSQKFALVDRNGKIRGYYDSNSRDEMKRLESDVRSL